MNLWVLPQPGSKESSVDELSELRRRLELTPQLAPGTVPTEIIRRNRIEGHGGLQRPELLPQAHDEYISGPEGDIPIRVFIPRTYGAIYLHFHGGGWSFGSIWEQDPMLWELASRAEVAVVSVGYRLAPEHPYPAALEDAVSSALWVLNDVGGLGRHKILMGGESSGAHLAVEAVLRLRDRHAVGSEVAGIQLSYGIFDLAMTPSQRSEDTLFPGLSRDWLCWFYDQLLPDQNADQRRDPAISPMYAELTNLPPAHFTVGTADLVLDDSVLMAMKWAVAGNYAELGLYPGAPHGFRRYPLRLAECANGRIYDFLLRCQVADKAMRAVATAPYG